MSIGGLGYQKDITAGYALLCEALLAQRQSDAASEVIELGLSKCGVNSERFF